MESSVLLSLSASCYNDSMNVIFRCKELLVSKIYHEFKVNWDFLKGTGGCSSQVQNSHGT